MLGKHKHPEEKKRESKGTNRRNIESVKASQEWKKVGTSSTEQAKGSREVEPGFGP